MQWCEPHPYFLARNLSLQGARLVALLIDFCCNLFLLKSEKQPLVQCLCMSLGSYIKKNFLAPAHEEILSTLAALCHLIKQVVSVVDTLRSVFSSKLKKCEVTAFLPIYIHVAISLSSYKDLHM